MEYKQRDTVPGYGHAAPNTIKTSQTRRYTKLYAMIMA